MIILKEAKVISRGCHGRDHDGSEDQVQSTYTE